MAVSIGAAPALLSWPEENEERDPGQVADFLLVVCSALVGRVEDLEEGDRDGADLCQWGVLFCLGGELSAQA